MIPESYIKHAETMNIEEEDVVEWLNNNALDFDVLLSSRKDIKEVRLLVTFGGPNVWYILDGSEYVTIEYCEAFKGCETQRVHNPNAEKIFYALVDLFDETWLKP